MTRRKRVVSASILMLLAAGVAVGQSYPVKPVRIIVPYAAGGAVDIVARSLGQELSKRFNQAVIIDNRTGAGGNIGSELVAKAAPDGYTLLLASPGNAINATLYAKMPYNPATDLTPVALIGYAPTILLAGTSFPTKNVRELVTLAKTKPGTITFGSGGAGTTEHLAGEMFKSAASIDIVHVPYKGGNAALNDVIGGQIAIMFINQLGGLPQVKAGKLKVLGVAAVERSQALPDVPTLAEQGFPDFNVAVWWGLMGPGGVPKELVARLNRDVAAALGAPEMKERLAFLTAQPLPGSVEYFNTFFADELERWARVVRASGARAE
jgi:tripartite-type tricarboxylate transporter receptor subunit TctC